MNQRRQFLLQMASLTAGGLILPSLGRAQGSAKKAKVALVLGGGSARGFAHVGVVKALELAGIVPDLIVGTSVGSLVGSFFAGGLSGVDMEQAALTFRDVDVLDPSIRASRGMASGVSISNMVNKYLKDRPIEKLQTPFVALATNLGTGLPHLFDKGNAGLAVQASCSIPGVFEPAKLDGMEFVDGGLISPLPVSIAKQLGADFTIAVDISANSSRGNPDSMFDLLARSFDIMAKAISEREGKDASVLIMPDVSQYDGTNFKDRGPMMIAGYQATQQKLGEIFSKLEELNGGDKGKTGKKS